MLRAVSNLQRFPEDSQKTVFALSKVPPNFTEKIPQV
jgi:hypothetical protein